MKKIVFLPLISLAIIPLILLFTSKSDNNNTQPEKPADNTYKADWEMIQQKGILRIITPPSEEVFLSRDAIPGSFETNNAAQFARKHNLEPIIIEAPAYDSILPWIKKGKADLAVASLTVTEQRSRDFLPSRPVRNVREYLIGPKDSPVRSLNDLKDKTVALRQGSSYVATLNLIRDSMQLSINVEYVPGEMHTEEIIYEISQGNYDYTICDSDIARAVLAYMDEVDTLLTFPGLRNIAWFMRNGNYEFKSKLDRYLSEFAILGELNEISTGDFDSIKERNVIRFVTRNNAASYWIHRGREVGFDFELMNAFANNLGMNLKIMVADSRDDLLNWVKEGRADIAAATITKTNSREKIVDFSHPYLLTREVIVTAPDEQGKSIIQTLDDLEGRTVHVRENSSYEETLMRLRDENNLNFEIHLLDGTVETEEVLWKVHSGEYDITVCDDYLAFIELNHGHNIAIGPHVSGEREIGWVIRKDNPRLKSVIDEFFTKSDHRPRSLYYNIIYNRYFRKGGRQRPPAVRADIQNRLSEYDEIIRARSDSAGFDWRAIAALIYQESKFDPNAESWVGAQGLMQLMPATARQFISGDIRDPQLNVYAGVRYLNILINRFDPELPYNERFNFALASYNAGYGHVLDARRLAASLGLDRDKWIDNVERAMLLLAQPEYYRNARHGYCRGQEPFTYVRNIRALYDSYRQVLE
ncbi:Soluble lytic murein transglycosylase [Chitinispirillum alkaliphilum]|nr:Soluble lytic murein transglycosylase [Chitinispirillum alkaliphilum]